MLRLRSVIELAVLYLSPIIASYNQEKRGAQVVILERAKASTWSLWDEKSEEVPRMAEAYIPLGQVLETGQVRCQPYS